MRETKVEQLMTKGPVTCGRETTLNDAAKRMWENDCGSLPVVEDERDAKVIGMITDRDICMAAHHTGKGLTDLRVGDSMSGEVVSCAPQDDLRKANELMRRAQVRRLPITDDGGRLRGVLTLGQMARAARDGRDGSLGRDEVGSTLSAITEPTGSAGEDDR